MRGTSVGTTPERIPADASRAGDGIVIGAGPIPVDAYIDFLCPFCRQFEERASSTLMRLVSDGAISLVYHPLAFLDRLSTNHYSSRASAASGCAADAHRFDAYKVALFANQPAEGGPGWTDEELIELGHAVGLTDEGFDRCVAAGAYLPWTAYVTARAIERGVSGTPTVFVAGVGVPAEPDVIAAAVAEAAG